MRQLFFTLLVLLLGGMATASNAQTPSRPCPVVTGSGGCVGQTSPTIGGSITIGSSTTAAEQPFLAGRVGRGFPVPYFIPSTATTPIAFDVGPSIGALDADTLTGVAWVDICDSISTCTNPEVSGCYESARLGIYASGNIFLGSQHGTCGAYHALLLAKDAGTVCVGCTDAQGTSGPNWLFAVNTNFGGVNPTYALQRNGTDTAWFATAAATSSWFTGTVQDDVAVRGNGGRMFFGSNSSGTAGLPSFIVEAGASGAVGFNGTVSTPIVTLTGTSSAAGTGIHRPATNQLAISTNGTDRFTLTTTTITSTLPITGTTLTLNAIASDSGQTDNTVCIDGSGVTRKGSGTLGICLGTSSARFKTGITALAPGLTEIMALKPKSFYLDKAHGDPTKLMYGFIAEDVVRVLPKLVSKDSLGRPNTADYVGIIPVLVKAIQQQQREIEALIVAFLASVLGLLWLLHTKAKK